MYCICLKERFLKIVYFRYVSWIIFPLAPDNSSSAISKCLKIDKIDNGNKFPAGANAANAQQGQQYQITTTSIAHLIKYSIYMCKLLSNSV